MTWVEESMRKVGDGMSKEVAIVDDQDNEWLDNLSIPSGGNRQRTASAIQTTIDKPVRLGVVKLNDARPQENQ